MTVGMYIQAFHSHRKSGEHDKALLCAKKIQINSDFTVMELLTALTDSDFSPEAAKSYLSQSATFGLSS